MVKVVINERPSYRNFDRMNSAERMQLSKDIFEQGLSYSSNISLDPDDSYEGLLNELVNRRMSKRSLLFDQKKWLIVIRIGLMYYSVML